MAAPARSRRRQGPPRPSGAGKKGRPEGSFDDAAHANDWACQPPELTPRCRAPLFCDADTLNRMRPVEDCGQGGTNSSGFVMRRPLARPLYAGRGRQPPTPSEANLRYPGP